MSRNPFAVARGATGDPYADFAAFGDVRKPEDAEPPILGPAARQVLHSWMYELNFTKELARVGVKPRTRAMMKGPPGTGKTTLAWHVAARLGLPLVVVETPSLISKYVGQTGEQIGQLFSLARQHGGKVALFFDELDAIASARGEGGQAAAKEKNNVVIALLQMMDRHNGLLFAATNQPDLIDPAVWRRFQMQIEVGLPAAEERFAIVKRYFVPFDVEDDSIDAISAALGGASPALIREVVESVKRDLVLAPRLGQSTAPAAIFGRIMAATSPSAGMPTPPLWLGDHHTDDSLEALAAMPWPPTLPEKPPTRAHRPADA